VSLKKHEIAVPAGKVEHLDGAIEIPCCIDGSIGQ
jgi:hypothetical protein